MDDPLRSSSGVHQAKNIFFFSRSFNTHGWGQKSNRRWDGLLSKVAWFSWGREMQEICSERPIILTLAPCRKWNLFTTPVLPPLAGAGNWLVIIYLSALSPLRSHGPSGCSVCMSPQRGKERDRAIWHTTKTLCDWLCHSIEKEKKKRKTKKTTEQKEHTKSSTK